MMDGSAELSSSDGMVAMAMGEDSLIAEMTTDLSLATAQCKSAYGLKQCLVCGDRALGFNFSVVSCESCKAFFRRNAHKTISGRCNGDCEVTAESRAYCKRCRLQKCFTVGMKRDLILNDQQKQFRCRKIQENRLRRSGSGGFYPPGTTGASAASPDSAADSSSMTPDLLGVDEPPEAAGGPPAEALSPCRGPVTHMIASEVDVGGLEGLDKESRDLLNEVLTAFRTTFDRPMEHQPLDAPSNVELLNMADTSVRRLVKMAKQLALFRELDQEDQISLLKGAVVEVLILRSSKMFNLVSLDWQVSKEGRQHTVRAAALTHGSPESMTFILQYQRFVRSLLASTLNDNVVLMLLIVMTLLSPDRATDPRVCGAQERYAGVLARYVALIYPHQPLMLPRLVQRLADIRDMNEKHTALLMNVQVDQLEPLITEIFDLAAC